MARRINFFLAVYISFSIIFTPSVFAGAMTGGATEVTQILNNVQLMLNYISQIEQVSNQVTQIANQIKMYQNMVVNTKNMVTQPLQSATDSILRLRNIIDQVSQLSYVFSNTDDYLRQLDADYSSIFNGTSLTTFSELQKNWRDALYNACEASLKTVGLEVSNVATEQDLLTSLASCSSSAEGQKQAIQAGNEIALHLASQMEKLKVLTSSQAQVTAVYYSQQKANEEAEQAKIEQLYDYDPNYTHPNDNAIY